MGAAWLQTIVATDPVDKLKSEYTHLPWKCIYDSSEDPAFGNESVFQLWVCHRDLKEDFIDFAFDAFGKDKVQQIVMIGHAEPRIEYIRKA